MVRPLFLFLALTSISQASTVDPREFDAPAEEQLPLDQRATLEDMLVNRQPAILHEPVYEPAPDEDVAVPIARDEISERAEEPVREY
jgi:hypothetical protein